MDLAMSSARYRRGIAVCVRGSGTLVGDQQPAAMTEPH
jgi:hypothetical protein